MERRRFLLGLAALIGGAAALTAATPEAQALPAPADPAKDLTPAVENASAGEPEPAAAPLDGYWRYRRRRYRVYRVYRVRRVYRRRVYRRRYYRRYW